MVTFEALGLRGEQDPWAFYYCGKNNYCLITSDKSFLDHFTHMAAIQLGKTRIFAFTSGNENMHLRGKAFVKAQAKIFRVIKHHRPRLSLRWDLRLTLTLWMKNLCRLRNCAVLNIGRAT